MKRVSRFWYGLIVVWPGLWLGILQNVVGILCLGYYVPGWDIEWMFTVGTKFYRRR